MGAFGITIDTLSSISSAFGKPKKGGKQKSDGLSGLAINLGDASLRSFKEFSTGMLMLHKYSSHNSSNVQEITRQNLKLLHTNLKSDAEYRKVVNSIRSRTTASPQWAWIPLLCNADLDAGLLYIPLGQSVAPQKPGANLTIRDNSLHAPFARIASQNTSRQLYLSLAGNPIVEYRNPAVPQLGPKFLKTSSHPEETRCLRNSESFTGESGHDEIQLIYANQKDCLLLNINLFEQ